MTEPIDALLRSIVYRLNGSQDACAKAIMVDCEEALRSRPAAPPAVPREPTLEMLVAATNVTSCSPHDWAWQDIWKAMYDAAQADEAQRSSPATESSAVRDCTEPNVLQRIGPIPPAAGSSEAGTNAELCARLRNPKTEAWSQGTNGVINVMTDFADLEQSAAAIESLERQVAEWKERATHWNDPLGAASLSAHEAESWRLRAETLEANAQMANARAERAEAAAAQEARRLDFLIAVTTADGPAEDDPRCMAMALAFAEGKDGRDAIDAALAKGSG